MMKKKRGLRQYHRRYEETIPPQMTKNGSGGIPVGYDHDDEMIRQYQQETKTAMTAMTMTPSPSSPSPSSSSSKVTATAKVSRSTSSYSWGTGLLMGLILGASIASIAISSNQATTLMMLQSMNNHPCEFQDDKTFGGSASISPISDGSDKKEETKKNPALRLPSSSSSASASASTAVATTTTAIATTTTTTKTTTAVASSSINLAPGDMIAYGAQGPASTYLVLKERFEKVLEPGTYEFFYHAFDEDCSADGCIFQQGTTFAEGKNLVVKTIAKSANYQRFKYINLFDDDTVIWNTKLCPVPPGAANVLSEVERGWATFHEYLLKETTTYPLLKPKFFATDKVDPYDTYQSCTDEQMWVFRRDHLDLFYPFMTLHKTFFWLSAMHVFRFMERCYPGGFLVLHEWATRNRVHRYGVPTDATNPDWVRQAQRDYLNMKFPELSPWIVPNDEFMGFIQQRCTVKQVPPQGVHPECKKLTESLFQRWINDEYNPDDMIGSE